LKRTLVDNILLCPALSVLKM